MATAARGVRDERDADEIAFSSVIGSGAYGTSVWSQKEVTWRHRLRALGAR